MNKYIQRQEFLALCEALEKNIITLEQFKIISNIADEEERKIILNFMMIENINIKNELFEKIIERIERQAICEVLIGVFNKIPIYKLDLERQKFILEIIGSNPRIIKSILKLFENDFLWNNKEFVEKIKNTAQNTKQSNHIFIKEFNFINYTLIDEIKKNPAAYEKDEIIKLLENTYKLPNCETVEDYIKCLRIESMQKDPILFDYLIRAYKEASNRKWRVCNLICYDKLKEMDEHNRFATLTEKLKEIGESLEKENDKELLNFFDNILNIEKEIIEKYEDEFFKFLIDYAVEKENFYQTKELVEYARKKSVALEEISIIKEELKKIERDNVRQLVLDTYLKDKDLFNKVMLKYLRYASYSEAQLLITRVAIKKNSQEIIKKSLENYGERFKEGFIEYLNIEDLTKEELLAIRDEVKILPSEFSHIKETFIVDTSSIVEEKETTEEIKEEKPENPQVTKKKKREFRLKAYYRSLKNNGGR